MGIKTCNKCNVDLIVGENAYKNQYKCKSCVLEYRRKWDKSEAGKMSQHKWATNKAGVYGIFSGETCLYVGESSWLNKRLNIHKSCINNPTIAPKSHKQLYIRMSKHNNIQFRILEATVNHKEQEQVWIEYMTPLYN
jgi:hypothetical protein